MIVMRPSHIVSGVALALGAAFLLTPVSVSAAAYANPCDKPARSLTQRDLAFITAGGCEIKADQTTGAAPSPAAPGTPGQQPAPGPGAAAPSPGTQGGSTISVDAGGSGVSVG